MKILFLSHNFYPFVGGIEIISEILANAFIEAGHEVHLATWALDKENNKSFRFQVFRNPSKFQLFQQHAWAELVFENNPCLQLGWPGLFFNKPSVISLHTWIKRSNGKIGIRDLIKLRWWLNRAKRVVAVSNALRIESWPTAQVISNPYRASEFKLKNNVDKNLDFIFLGRLVSDKGADLAIRAIHMLKSSEEENEAHYRNRKLTIVGDGPERANLKKLVTELEMDDFVNFTGTLSGDKLVDCLNSHRYLLVPSIWEEPFGVVALEAMACGCVPITSDGGGLPEAIGNAGATFKSGDLLDLVKVIKHLFQNPEIEQHYRDFAPKHLKKHQPLIIAKKYLEVINSVNSDIKKF